jgi:hypothetical protein
MGRRRAGARPGERPRRAGREDQLVRVFVLVLLLRRRRRLRPALAPRRRPVPVLVLDPP